MILIIRHVVLIILLHFNKKLYKIMETIFKSVELAPKDPILGLNEQFNSDSRVNKVNLGVGVYYNENGNIPTLSVVQEVENSILKSSSSRSYLPIDGIPNYNKSVQKLLFCDENQQYKEQGRLVTVQTLGGTGALKVGADFLRNILPNNKVLISNPTWENHKAIFEGAGFFVESYKYYDEHTKGLNFNGMLSDINKSDKNTIIILHACCHNPTGVDPSEEQWIEIAKAIKSRQMIPFIDIAYQGFGSGIKEDSIAIKILANMNIPILISSSFSKSFALYGERVGALTILTGNNIESSLVLSQIKKVIRANYSNPPTHGAKIVSTILSDTILHKKWEKELENMRNRIKDMRNKLVANLKNLSKNDFNFINTQRGMFSYSGLNSSQVSRLMNDYGIYAVSNGRICIAALNSNNVEFVARSISHVMNSENK